MDISEYGRKFLEEMTCKEEKKRKTRFKSWEYCYNEFQNANEQLKNNRTIDIDTLSLHLFVFLASWGMYRASTFLLKKDYKVHYNAVKLLLYGNENANKRENYKYDALWKMKIDNYRDEKTMRILFDNQDGLVYRLKKIYNNNRIESVKTDVSDILISKILMGTMGCVPAYDGFFKEEVRKIKIKSKKIPGKLNKKSIEMLADYYIENEDKLEKIRDNFNSQMDEKYKKKYKYTPMKILDCCFWYKRYKAITKKKD